MANMLAEDIGDGINGWHEGRTRKVGQIEELDDQEMW
jgi:hypothetical protein